MSYFFVLTLRCSLFLVLVDSVAPSSWSQVLSYKTNRRGSGSGASHELSRRDGIPPSTWILPSSLTTPPSCVARLPNCPWNGNLIASCTTEQCVEAFIGSCMQRANMVDLSCVCPQLTSNGCSCANALEDYISLHWLYVTCGIVSNWTGLPAGWNTSIPEVDLIPLASFGTLANDYCTGDWGTVGVGPEVVSESGLYPTIPLPYLNEISFPPGYRLPSFQSLACSQTALSRLLDSTLNATDIEAAELKAKSEYDLYLDEISFCTSSYDRIPPECGDQDLDKTRFLLWMQNLCPDVTGKWEWPSNWEDTLPLDFPSTSSYIAVGELTPPPACIRSGPCFQSFNSSERSCVKTRCLESPQLSGYYGSEGYCNPIGVVPQTYTCVIRQTYNISCFCEQCKCKGTGQELSNGRQ